MKKVLQIHPKDNVAVALVDLTEGETCLGIFLRQNIPSGHKFALCNIAAREPLVKYGMPIGEATASIQPGEHVHVHNLRTSLNESTPVVEYRKLEEPETSAPASRCFSGYGREDGKVGIRNDLWVIPLVGCINGPVRQLVRQAQHCLSKDTMQIVSLEHPYGCSQLGEDLHRTASLLASLARHPNAGGVLIVSLGCENNSLDYFRPLLGPFDERRIRFLKMQEPGSELERGMEQIRKLILHAEQSQKSSFPMEKLCVGLKCGGSDAFSGITANPLLGRFADRLVGEGGTVVLTEVPEMFGAETLLLSRCHHEAIHAKCVRMLDDFRQYFLRYGQPVYENPSPGNKEGGISTLEEKSLGCVQKGGTSWIVDVLNYADSVVSGGSHLLSGPGNDLVSSTALAAAGCQLILFTTGRGTPFGTVIPTLKVSSNSHLAKDKPHWIDFDAGRLLSETALDALTDELFELVLDVASEKQMAKNEQNGYREIAIFREDVTL